jgi:hypothetical protein
MERTESVIIQVSPNYENAKIKEMEIFGWNLQNRQEIHEKGDAYAVPQFLDPSSYITGTVSVMTEVSKYVKLHFVRSLNTSNLDKIKILEDKYFSFPAPDFPQLCPGGGCLIFFWYPLWPLYYFFKYKPDKSNAENQLKEILKQREKIIQKVKEIDIIAIPQNT